MEPVSIGKKIKELYPQYAKVDDAALGQKYISRYGPAIEGIRSGNLDIKDLPEKQRVGVSFGLSASGFKKEDQETTQEERKAQGLATSGIRSLNLVQKEYEKDPTVVVKQLLPGKFASRTFDSELFNSVDTLLRLRTGAQAPKSEVRAYMSAFGPKFGDSAEVVQQKLNTLQQNLLDAAGKTEQFKQSELNVSDKFKANPLGGLMSTLFPKLTEEAKTVANLPKAFPQYAQDIKERGPLGAPSAELLSMLTPGSKKEDFGNNRLLNALTSAYKSTTISQGAAGEVATPFILASGAKQTGAKLLNALKPKVNPPTLKPEVLKEGIKLVEKGKKIRDVAIQKAEQTGKGVDGSKLATKIKEWGQKAIATGEDSKIINRKVKTAMIQFKGKVFTPKKAKELWDVATQGFKESGKAGNTVLASYQRALRDGLRSELEQIAPGFEKGTAEIAKGLSKDKILRSVSDTLQKAEIKGGLKTPKAIESELSKFLKRAGSGAAGAASTVLLLKLLGLGGSGDSGQ